MVDVQASFPPPIVPPPQQNDAAPWIVLLVLAGLFALVWGVTQWRLRRRLERDLAGLRTSMSHARESAHTSREDVAFQQHVKLNELQIAKLTAEVELLQQQVKHKATDDDRLEAGKEYHELMVEKARLEMDSLRLQITEQRRRVEDWRSDD